MSDEATKTDTTTATKPEAKPKATPPGGSVEEAAAKKVAADNAAKEGKTTEPEKKPEVKEPEVKEGETLVGGDAKEKATDGTLVGGDADLEKKPEGEKGDPEKQAAEEVKASDLTLPEGTLLHDGSMEEIASFAKEQGFSKKQTQAVLEAQSAGVSSFVERQTKALKEESKKWMADLKVDKEVGGDKFLENVGLVDRLSKKIFSEGFRKDLNATGYGNHPELFKGLAKAARLMGEDKLVPGTPAPSGAPKTAAQQVYPDHYNDDGTPKKG